LFVLLNIFIIIYMASILCSQWSWITPLVNKFWKPWRTASTMATNTECLWLHYCTSTWKGALKCWLSMSETLFSKLFPL